MARATEAILLGEPMQQVAGRYREELLRDMGMDPEEVEESLFRKETIRFMNQVCRHLGERYAEDARVSMALQDWVRVVEEYDAFDVLLSHYDFEGRDRLVEKGRMLFPGPLTAHW